MTGNVIGDEGAKAISEMLNVNTTVSKLSIGGEKYIWKRKRKKGEEIWMIVNEIEDEGKKMVNEAWGDRGKLVVWSMQWCIIQTIG